MHRFFHLSAIPLAILFVSTIAFLGWSVFDRDKKTQELQQEIRLRIKSWWIICAVFILAFYGGLVPAILLFGIISAVALAEYLSVAAPGSGHPLLFLAVVLQYLAFFRPPFAPISPGSLGLGMLLVIGDIFLDVGDRRDLRSAAKIYFGLIVCVYFISAAPALLLLPLADPDQPLSLLFDLLLLTGLSDVFQFCVGKPLGKHKIAPALSPKKSWEGLLGGMALTAVAAAALDPITPFSKSTDSAVGASVCLIGFLGGLTLSYIKRLSGKKNFGDLLPGHGGILDRVDSLCFSAPLFYYFVKYAFT